MCWHTFIVVGPTRMGVLTPSSLTYSSSRYLLSPTFASFPRQPFLVPLPSTPQTQPQPPSEPTPMTQLRSVVSCDGEDDVDEDRARQNQALDLLVVCRGAPHTGGEWVPRSLKGGPGHRWTGGGRGSRRAVRRGGRERQRHTVMACDGGGGVPDLGDEPSPSSLVVRWRRLLLHLQR